ncbi:TPA: phage replisome organizer N-terminal domain-containing protein, partial [Streptococcus suis]
MASEIKWIKIVTDIFDDEKILLIESLPEADTIIVVWFKLLTLAGKQNYGGVLMMNDRVHYTDEMLSTLFRRPLNTVRAALQTFEQFGMIEIINNAITIPNWEKHQSVESMERVREQARKR